MDVNMDRAEEIRTIQGGKGPGKAGSVPAAESPSGAEKGSLAAGNTESAGNTGNPGGAALFPPASSAGGYSWKTRKNRKTGGAPFSGGRKNRGSPAFAQNREFSTGFHPAVEFLYFALALGFGMFFTHPLCLALSFAGAFSFSLCLRGKKAVRLGLLYMLPFFLLTAAVNPLFSHGGKTVLAYFPSGNPFTLESLLYGLGAGGMLVCMLLWFSCVTEVITAEKFLWLFGRALPALSLVLSMTLRFVPLFVRRLRQVSEARRCMGGTGGSSGKGKGAETERKRRKPFGPGRRNGAVNRGREAVKTVSILLTWALENAVETGDSMKARGCGLPGRTAFSLYRFTGRDKDAASALLFCGFFLLSAGLSGAAEFRYFPTVKGVFVTAGPESPITVCFFLAYGLLCLAPVYIYCREVRVWKRWEQPEDRRRGLL